MPASEFTPTVAEVAALMHARTKDAFGNEDGEFNDDTRPTGDQVESLIQDAVVEVTAAVGMVDLPSHLQPAARQACKLHTAAAIEASFWPEQADAGDTNPGAFAARYERSLRALLSGLERFNQSGHGFGSVRVKSAVLASHDDATVGAAES